MKNWGRWIVCLFIMDCILAAGLYVGSMNRVKDVGIALETPARYEAAHQQTFAAANGEEAETDIKKVALTFDDGPNDSYTELLLEGLKERGVRATFFLLGKEAEENPDLVREIYESGHLIGNHTYSHVNLSELSNEEALAQINNTNQIIFDITGYYPEFIRPPYGCIKEGIPYEPEMIEVLWNIDARDWETDDAGYVVQKVVKDVKENGIILLHDASISSVQAAFVIVDILQERGYTFVTVDQILLD